MKKYYVSGKYDGIDIGMEVEAQNQYMAAYCFIDKASLKLGVGMKRMYVSEVEEVGLCLK